MNLTAEPPDLLTEPTPHPAVDHEPFASDEPPGGLDALYRAFSVANWHGVVRLKMWEAGRDRLLTKLKELSDRRTALLGRAYAWADDDTAEPWSEKDAYRLQLLSYVLRLVQHFISLTDDAVAWLKIAAVLQNEQYAGMPLELIRLESKAQREEMLTDKLLEIIERYRDELHELRPLAAQRDAELPPGILEQYLSPPDDLATTTPL